MKQKIVLEIRGGTLVGLYANSRHIETHVVDWDEIAEHPGRVNTRAHPDPLAAMPVETKELVAGAVKRPVAHVMN